MNIKYKSKAIRLAEDFLKDIWSSQYSKDEYLPPEDELAHRYCTSRMTIRKVLSILERDQIVVKVSNCGTKINPELNLPEPPNAGLSKPITIGAVMAAFPDALTIEINQGIRDYAEKHGMSFLLIQNTEGPEALFRDIRQLEFSRLFGLIWCGMAPGCSEQIQKLASRHFPLVCVDNPLDGVNVPYVSVDNFGGMYLAATSLLNYFRSGIYYFGGIPELMTQRRRYDGYCQAMLDFGLKNRISDFSIFFEKNPESRGWFDEKHDRPAQLAAAKLFQRSLPFAVVAENDYIAQILLNCAKALNLTVGHDFFLCGFDDLPLAASLDLSSVRQPRHELGYEAARLLCQMLQGGNYSGFAKILPVSLVPRGSSDITNSSMANQAECNATRKRPSDNLENRSQ